MTLPEFTYVATVLSDHLGEGPWREGVRRWFADSGVTLDPEGEEEEAELRRDGEVFGMYRFAELEDEADLLERLGFEQREVPFAGKPVGVFRWEHYQVGGMPNAAMSACRGEVARIEAGPPRRFVDLIQYPLTNLLSRGGFDQGGVFLYRSDQRPEYWKYVVGEIKRVLAEAGLDGHPGSRASNKNPVMLGSELRRNGEPVASEPAELARLEVALWTFNLKALEGFDFWYRL